MLGEQIWFGYQANQYQFEHCVETQESQDDNTYSASDSSTVNTQRGDVFPRRSISWSPDNVSIPKKDVTILQIVRKISSVMYKNKIHKKL